MASVTVSDLLTYLLTHFWKKISWETIESSGRFFLFCFVLFSALFPFVFSRRALPTDASHGSLITPGTNHVVVALPALQPRQAGGQEHQANTPDAAPFSDHTDVAPPAARQRTPLSQQAGLAISYP
jgi:hypothetical protein